MQINYMVQKHLTKIIGFSLLLIILLCRVNIAYAALYEQKWVQEEDGRWRFLNYSEFLKGGKGITHEGTEYDYFAAQWIDGNADGIAEKYYFDADGYLITDKTFHTYGWDRYVNLSEADHTVNKEGQEVDRTGNVLKYYCPPYDSAQSEAEFFAQVVGTYSNPFKGTEYTIFLQNGTPYITGNFGESRDVATYPLVNAYPRRDWAYIIDSDSCWVKDGERTVARLEIYNHGIYVGEVLGYYFSKIYNTKDGYNIDNLSPGWEQTR